MSQIATESEPGQNINLTDYQYSLELTMKLTPHKGMCHAHTSGHRYDLTPLKGKGLPIAVPRQTTYGRFNWHSVSQPECSAHRVGGRCTI